jgi:gliding motility-associated-like protein
MQIVVNPIITPVFNDFGTLCYGSNFQLPGISNNNILGVWSLSFNNLTTDTYTFTPNSNFCSVPITITTTIRPDFDFDFRIYCVNENLNIEVVAINNSINLNTASFSWSFDTIILDNPNKIFDLTFYKESTITTEVLPHLLTITITDENGCEKAKELTISNDYCKIQKGISVDENDLNDFFDLSLLNVKKLSVFNRYGMKVFDKVNYKDEWKGQTHEGNILPSGVYYYIIEFNENIEPKTGWIYLLK